MSLALAPRCPVSILLIFDGEHSSCCATYSTVQLRSVRNLRSSAPSSLRRTVGLPVAAMPIPPLSMGANVSPATTEVAYACKRKNGTCQWAFPQRPLKLEQGSVLRNRSDSG